MEENGSLTKEAEAVMDFINSCKYLPAGVTTKMEMLMAKVQDVDENYKKSEKTLIDHGLSRFASPRANSEQDVGRKAGTCKQDRGK